MTHDAVDQGDDLDDEELDDEDQAPPDDRPPPLDFDAWASLSAGQLKLDEPARAAVLEQAGVRQADFQRADAHWSAMLTADLEARDLTRARRYGAICADELAKRAASRPPAPVKVEPAPVKVEPAPVKVEPAPAPSPASPPPSYLVSPAPHAPRPAPAPPQASLDSTRARDATLTVSAPPAAVALPFVAAPAASPVPASVPSAAPPARPAAEPSGTISLAQPTTDSPLPFTVSDPGVAFTLEQYASFRTELGVFPEKRAEILSKYGVMEEQRRLDLDETWRKRFVSDPALQQRFIQLSTRYMDYLLKQKGK
jgi:hypothetical protein